MKKLFDATVLRQIATLGPIGFTALPGTWASFATATILFFITRILSISPWLMGFFALCITAASCVVLHLLNQHNDDRSIVVDEVAGMTWSLVGATTPAEYVTAFLLFRLFDITKLAGVSVWERLPGVWGIMADDLWAAVITLTMVHAVPILNALAST